VCLCVCVSVSVFLCGCVCVFVLLSKENIYLFTKNCFLNLSDMNNLKHGFVL
jgi:hypothetical protein